SANTTTLEESWGAKIVARGTGIVLNNEMHDFNVQPGRSTRAGRIGTAPNTIAPGKRMLSSMCPTIVERDGRLLLVTGSPGGRSIPSTVLRVVTAVLDHGLSPRDAVELARVHHGLYPDRLDVEATVSREVRDALVARGHVLRERDRQGDAHSIGVDPSTGRLVAAADRRRSGAAARPVDPR
ncbi:MAG: gamma-glutamyltransferase, partial [Planctomycetota bacterium JB042]